MTPSRRGLILLISRDSSDYTINLAVLIKRVVVLTHCNKTGQVMPRRNRRTTTVIIKKKQTGTKRKPKGSRPSGKQPFNTRQRRKRHVAKRSQHNRKAKGSSRSMPSGDTTFTGTIRLDDLYMDGTTFGTVACTVFDKQISPRDFAGSRIAQMAPLWEYYKFESLSMHFENTLPDIAGGQFISYFDKDITDNNASSAGQNANVIAMALDAAGSKTVSLRDRTSVVRMPKMDQYPRYKTSGTDDDERAMQCRLWIVQSAPVLNYLLQPVDTSVKRIMVGKIYLRYTVRFMVPQGVSPNQQVLAGMELPLLALDQTWTRAVQNLGGATTITSAAFAAATTKLRWNGIQILASVPNTHWQNTERGYYYCSENAPAGTILASSIPTLQVPPSPKSTIIVMRWDVDHDQQGPARYVSVFVANNNTAPAFWQVYGSAVTLPNTTFYRFLPSVAAGSQGALTGTMRDALEAIQLDSTAVPAYQTERNITALKEELMSLRQLLEPHPTEQLGLRILALQSQRNRAQLAGDRDAADTLSSRLMSLHMAYEEMQGYDTTD